MKYLAKEARTNNGIKMVSLINSVGKVQEAHVKKRNRITNLHYTQE